jgi:hypothetical protein
MTHKDTLAALVTIFLSLFGNGDAAASEHIEPNCETKDALSICLEPQAQCLQPEAKNGEDLYVAASVRYFLSMKTNQGNREKIATESEQRMEDYLRPLEPGEWNPLNKWFRKTTIHPRYSPLVVRYEFPPWLLTTGYGVQTMRNVDELLRFYATDYKSIECRSFDTQPFGRCHVVFLYGKDDPKTPQDDRTECPIYEEFTFNDQGQITFIEAWTDHDGYLPMDPSDYWAEGENVKRLSTSIPGLGNAQGKIDPNSQAMAQAAKIFDASFEADYWDEWDHPIGPLTSMVEDIGGRFSFWPNWLKRTAQHEGSFLDGCRPPQ